MLKASKEGIIKVGRFTDVIRAKTPRRQDLLWALEVGG